MADADLYGILGVGREASSQEIKQAYRRLAGQLHPDKNPGNPQAEERFKAVNGAYAVLGDEEKRKIYDEFGANGLREGFDPEAARSYQRWAGGGPGGVRFDFGGGAGPFGAGLGGFGNLDELLGGLFGAGARSGRGPRAVHTEGRITVSLRQALRGEEVSLPGQGVTARIPAGIASGQRIRLPGKGHPGPAGRGDLFLTVQVAPPAGFTEDGDDLVFELPVTVGQAVRGAAVELPNPEGGLLTVQVPPGSQTGRRLRLRDRGMPVKGGGRGHLFVRLVVQAPPAPAEPDPRLEELLDALEGYYR